MDKSFPKHSSMDSKAHICLEFDGKAKRFMNALNRFPHARVMELLPILFALPEKKSIMLDIFSGSGFVSTFLSPLFSQIIQIDAVEQFSLPLSNSIFIAGNALESNTLQSIPNTVDFAACLAGFHHVLASTTNTDLRQATIRLRIDTLKQWKKKLGKKGCLMIIDVPAHGNYTTYSSNTLEADRPANINNDHPFFPPIYQACKLLNLPDSCFPDNLSGTNLSHYSHSINTRMKELTKKLPEPSLFFDNLVAQQSQVGHQAYFQSRRDLHKCFEISGFTNVQSHTCSTPWFFPTKADAIWFIHELFAIGHTPAQTPKDISSGNITLIQDAIDQHLGFQKFANGSVAIFWKLTYVWGYK